MILILLSVRLCVRVQKFCFDPLEWLNNSSWFPFFAATPLPYAVGTCAENIRHIFLASDILKKRPLLVRLRSFNGLLKFQIASPALFSIHFHRSKRSHLFELQCRLYYVFVTIYINIIFIFSRCAFLILKNLGVSKGDAHNNKSYSSFCSLLNTLSFPRIGLFPSVNTIYKELIKYPESKYRLWDIMSKRSYAFTTKYTKCWQEYLQGIGLKSLDRLIVLHIRNSDYHNDSGRRNYRNATIDNYFPLIENICNCGYNIVLLGGSSSDPIPQRDNIYDLRHGTRGKPCSIDIYLVQHCFFYIGMMSGPLDVAILFSRSTLVLNAYLPLHCFGYPSQTQYLLQAHAQSDGERIKGIRNLVAADIQLLDIHDLETTNYNLRELLPMQILDFCMTRINKNSNQAFQSNHAFEDITDLCAQQQYKVFSRLIKRNYSKVSAVRYDAIRFTVNALLSRGCVNIFEA